MSIPQISMAVNDVAADIQDISTLPTYSGQFNIDEECQL